MIILEKFVVVSSSLFDMTYLITIATTFSDRHQNVMLCLKNKLLFHY